MSTPAPSSALDIVALDAAVDRESGYAALVEQHGAGIFRLLVAMVGDQAAAEDLTQDTFLRAYEQWHQLRGSDTARGWLYTIAANLARQHLRRLKRWSWLPWDSVEYRAESGVSGDPAGLGEISPILDQLKPEDRAVLILMGVLDFTAPEAAATLGISHAAATKRWQRASARFRAVSAMEESHAM